MWCLNILIGAQFFELAKNYKPTEPKAGFCPALELEDFAHIFVLLNTAYVMFEDLDKKSTARD